MDLCLNPDNHALFLDIDGTLLDIAPKASEVVVPAQLIIDLASLQGRLGGALALISGRTIENIDSLFSPLKLACSGVHGAQIRFSPLGSAENFPPLPHTFRERLHNALSSLKGVFVEDKKFAVSVHYRQSAVTPEEIREILDNVVNGDEEKGLDVVSGRKVFEISRLSHDKGRAIKRFLEVPPFKGRIPVFLGDDVSDLPAMEVSRKMGGMAGRIAMEAGDDEAAFESPENVRAWINSMVSNQAGDADGRTES